MRVLILCAGDGTRWGDHLGVPKHLAPLCGEPILHRTIRQVLDRVPDAEIRVVVADTSDPRYQVRGARRVKARLDPTREQADKILSSAHLWGKDRTCVLFGDVWWDDHDLDVFLGDHRPWVAAARLGPNPTTGKRHAELFGFSFAPTAQPVIRQAAERCVALARSGQLAAWSGGWQILKSAAGVPDDHLVGPLAPSMKAEIAAHVIETDGWTDDFDAPGDWDAWCWAWAHTPDTDRPPKVT